QSPAWPIGSDNCASVQVDGALGDRQAQSYSVRRISPEEGLEEVRKLARIDARAPIRNGDANPVVLNLKLYIGARIRRRKAHRVSQDVFHRTAQGVAIATNENWVQRFKPDALAQSRSFEAGIVNGFVQERDDIDSFDGQSRFFAQPAKAQNLLDHRI